MGDDTTTDSELTPMASAVSSLAGRLQATERALADAIDNLAALTERVEKLEHEVLPRTPPDVGMP